jgi:Domain of unknown function (DUF5658)
MGRILTVAVMGLMLTTTSVFAADEDGAKSLAPAISVVATSLAQHPDLASTVNLAAQFKAPRRPMALSSLYAGSAFLQGYDAYSTLTALKSGAVEANPLMKGITKSPAAFMAVKAGMTMASIMSAERMWKNNHRAGAVIMMIASNGMMAAVAAHNASVLQRVR